MMKKKKNGFPLPSGLLHRTAVGSLAACSLAFVAPAQITLAADVEEGLLRTAVLYDISTMDVARTTDDYLIPMNVYDRLFETRMNDGTAEVVNSLCEDYSISEDGLTYDFVLKDGIEFSNGSALTASDVQYSFERLLITADQNTEIPLEVAGGEALMKGEAETLEGFSVSDDTHFSITLNQANGGFLAELSSPVMSIFDKETMSEAEDFGTDPSDVIGTGPYIVTEWVPNDHYTLVYNENYRGPEPAVKKLIARVIPDASTQSLMFQNGELDMLDLGNLDSSIVETTFKTGYADQIVSTPRVGLAFLALNEKNEYLKDVNVRKAIGMAIDTDMIISSIYNKDAVRQNGIIPTGVWGHNDELQGFSYDPEGAKALLEEAGYREGEIEFELSMDATIDTSRQLIYQVVSQYLGAAGIKAEIKSYDHAAWLDKRGSGEMDAFVARWGMDYNDPANIMITFFGSVEATKERSLNYPDADVMARVAAAPSIVNDEARKAEYQELEEKIISEDAAWIPLLEDMHLYCIGDRVESFIPQWAGFTDFYAADVTLK